MYKDEMKAPVASWLGTWQDDGCSSRMERRIAPDGSFVRGPWKRATKSLMIQP